MQKQREAEIFAKALQMQAEQARELYGADLENDEEQYENRSGVTGLSAVKIKLPDYS